MLSEERIFTLLNELAELDLTAYRNLIMYKVKKERGKGFNYQIRIGRGGKNFKKYNELPLITLETKGLGKFFFIMLQEIKRTQERGEVFKIDFKPLHYEYKLRREQEKEQLKEQVKEEYKEQEEHLTRGQRLENLNNIFIEAQKKTAQLTTVTGGD